MAIDRRIENYAWAVFTAKDKSAGFEILADKMEVTPAGDLIFRKASDVIVHVQAARTFHSCEILSAWDGCPTHAQPLVKAGA